MVIITEDESSSIERLSNSDVSESGGGGCWWTGRSSMASTLPDGQLLGYGGNPWKEDPKGMVTRGNRKTVGLSSVPVMVSWKNVQIGKGTDVLRSEPQRASRMMAKTNKPLTKTRVGDGSRGPVTDRFVPDGRAVLVPPAKVQIDRQPPPVGTQQRQRFKPQSWNKARVAPKSVAPAKTPMASDYLSFGRWLAKSGFSKRPVAGEEPDSSPSEVITEKVVPEKVIPENVVERWHIKSATPNVLTHKSDDARTRITTALKQPKASLGFARKDNDKKVKIIYGNQKKSKGPEQKRIAKSNNELMKRILNAKSSISSFWKM